MSPDFAIAGHIRQLKDRGELPMVELTNSHGRAVVCLQGAQVIEYQPNGQAAALWLSNRSGFETGKAIRGGIPICWPWFGGHPQDPALPAHGLARTRRWQVLASGDDGETTSLRLGLSDDDTSRQLWSYRFELQLQITLGRQLSLTLTTRNPNDRPMPISEALHSYFSVSDIDQIRISGLEGCRYRDKLDNLNAHIQHNTLAITGETDRVYLDTDACVCVDDPVAKRQILISKQQSRSTVIWNPGAEKSVSMSDMDDTGYRSMLCVETANALDNSIEIAAGQSHQLNVQIESVPFDKTLQDSHALDNSRSHQ